MIKRLRVCVFCAVLACLVPLAFGLNTCHAQAWAPGAVQYWYSYPPGAYGPYLPNAQRGIPHFAAFPPVYYSHIVPRPYGYSPYAYVPGVVTPGFELCQPRHRCWAAAGGAASYGTTRDLAPRADDSSREAAEASASTGVSVGPVSIPNPYFSDGVGENRAIEPASGRLLRIRNPYFVGDAEPLAGGG